MLLVFVLGLAFFPVLAWRFVDPPLTGLMTKRLWQAATGDAPWRYRHDAVDLEDISPNLVMAVLASEDQEFLDHWGFDWDAIARARVYNRTHKRTRGASTLSQQTAKNVFLWEKRSWLRKGLEVPYTFAIELLWGKRRILEAYLNCVEFGPGIYGAEAASRHYFGVPASRLSVSQACLLAASLPAPRRNNPDIRTAFLSGRAAHAAGQIPLMDRRRILQRLGL
ncbi:MAG: putative monofunctional biosynthetic peptidoglycan transglycosylase [Fibrobacterota bacterium]